MMNKLILSLGMSLFLLSGCSSILPKGAPAPRQYTLNAPVTTEAGDKIPARLQILIPQATPGLETERIVLRNTDNQVDYFADTKWTGTLTALVQSLLVESFDNTHRLQSVGSDLVAINQNYNLLIEIRDFQAEYLKGSSNPRAHIRIIAKLIKSDTNDVVTTNTYDESAMASGNNLQEIIPAFDKAWQQASAKIVSDTLQTLGTIPVKK